MCGETDVAVNTPIALQVTGDCKQAVCDGAGATTTINLDADVKDDGNICTIDGCTGGTPSYTPAAPGLVCGVNQVCNDVGVCVGCLVDGDCTSSNECLIPKCVSGACATENAPDGTVGTSQTPNDCLQNQCVGGALAAVAYDPDLPADLGQCSTEACASGVGSHPPVAVNTPCTDNGGKVCDGAGACVACNTAADCPAAAECQTATCTNHVCGTVATPAGGNCSTGVCDANGTCQPTFVVVRLGTEGGSALGNTTAPAFLEERLVADGALVTKAGNPLALPIAAAGNNQPVTVAGSSTAEGGLSRSGNGAYLTLGGYGVAPGTATANASRVVARVDAAGTIDSTTVLTGALNSSIRGATSQDGTAFWASGNGNQNTGGVHYITLGSTAPVQVLAAPANARAVHVFGGQLYGSSGSGAFVNVFTIGTGLPTTTGQTATSLNGLPTNGASPYSFLFLDVNTNVAGFDRLYIADANDGIKKWDFDGTIWTVSNTFAIASGAYGVTGWYDGTVVHLIATQEAASANLLVSIVDDGSLTPAVNTIATAVANTAFRGVALPPR